MNTDATNTSLLSLDDEWINYVTKRTDPNETHPYLAEVEWQRWLKEPSKLCIQYDDLGSNQQLIDLINKRNVGIKKHITSYEAARSTPVHSGPSAKQFDIKSMTWSWLLSYGAGNVLSLDNRDGLITLISGKNGYGKTALLETICIGLFAESFPSRKSKNIINERAPEGEKAVVAVEFEIEGQGRYKVERRFSVSKSGGLTQTCDVYDSSGVKLVSGATQVNAWISTNVGTIEEFLGSCMVTQANDASFLSMDPKTQLGILSRVLSADTATAINDLFSDAYLAHETCLVACCVAIDTLSNQLLDVGDASVSDLQTIVDSAEKEMNALSMRSESLHKHCVGIRRDLLEMGMPELTNMLARASSLESHDALVRQLKELQDIAPLAKPIACTNPPRYGDVQDAANNLSCHLLNSVTKPTSTTHGLKEWNLRKTILLSKISLTGLTSRYATDIQLELDKLCEASPPNPPIGIEISDSLTHDAVDSELSEDVSLPELIQTYEALQAKVAKLTRACKWPTMQEYEAAREAFDRQVDSIINQAGSCDIEELAERVVMLQRLERIVNTAQANDGCTEYNDSCSVCMKRKAVVQNAMDEAEDAMARLEAAGTKSAELSKLVDKLVSLVDEQDTLWDPEGVSQRKRRRVEKELTLTTQKLRTKLGEVWATWRKRKCILEDALIAARELEAVEQHWHDEAERLDKFSTWDATRLQYQDDLNKKAGMLCAYVQAQIEEAQQIEDVKAALDAVPYYIELTKEIPSLQKNITQRIANVKAAIHAQQVKDEKKALVNEQLNKLTRMQGALKQRRDTLGLFRSMWKGFQTYMLAERVLPVLQARINKIMDEVCIGRPLKLVGCVAQDGSKITWAIEDVKGFTRAPLEKASGFQLSIASLATRIAVGQLVGVFRPRQLFIDEGFASCDAEHLERIPTLLRSLITSQMYSAVFIVTHNDKISAHVDASITISRVNGVSRVLV